VADGAALDLSAQASPSTGRVPQLAHSANHVYQNHAMHCQEQPINLCVRNC